jgi:Protein of unknown function (DUF2934)
MEGREERIREIAYRIWEEEGWPADQADRHWHLAQLIVLKEDAERAGLMPQAPLEPKLVKPKVA